MKTILVSFADLNQADFMIKSVAALARKFDAHVIGLYPIPGPNLLAVTHPGAFIPVDDQLQKLYVGQAPEIRDLFKSRMKADGLNFEWREVRSHSSYIAETIVQHGREADLILLPRGDHKGVGFQGNVSLAADTVLSSGRPILTVPPTKSQSFKLNRAVVGWDGSREAARAVFDALPLLKLTKSVNITCINPSKEMQISDDLPGTELAAALDRHGINVTTEVVKTRKRVGVALLERAQNADLLVIGAYGHSRLRELILGGVTDQTLKNMNCPVLMSK